MKRNDSEKIEKLLKSGKIITEDGILKVKLEKGEAQKVEKPTITGVAKKTRAKYIYSPEVSDDNSLYINDKVKLRLLKKGNLVVRGSSKALSKTRDELKGLLEKDSLSTEMRSFYETTVGMIDNYIGVLAERKIKREEKKKVEQQVVSSRPQTIKELDFSEMFKEEPVESSSSVLGEEFDLKIDEIARRAEKERFFETIFEKVPSTEEVHDLYDSLSGFNQYKLRIAAFGNRHRVNPSLMDRIRLIKDRSIEEYLFGDMRSNKDAFGMAKYLKAKQDGTLRKSRDEEVEEPDEATLQAAALYDELGPINKYKMRIATYGENKRRELTLGERLSLIIPTRSMREFVIEELKTDSRARGYRNSLINPEQVKEEKVDTFKERQEYKDAESEYSKLYPHEKYIVKRHMLHRLNCREASIAEKFQLFFTKGEYGEAAISFRSTGNISFSQILSNHHLNGEKIRARISKPKEDEDDIKIEYIDLSDAFSERISVGTIRPTVSAKTDVPKSIEIIK